MNLSSIFLIFVILYLLLILVLLIKYRNERNLPTYVILLIILYFILTPFIVYEVESKESSNKQKIIKTLNNKIENNYQFQFYDDLDNDITFTYQNNKIIDYEYLEKGKDKISFFINDKDNIIKIERIKRESITDILDVIQIE